MAASAAAASLGLFSVARAAENGVTDTEVVLGHTGILSGPLGAPIKVVMAGAGLAFDAVNAQGGVSGRKIRLVSLDDELSPEKAVANYEKLLGEHRAFAFFGCVGSATTAAAAKVLSQSGAPMVAGYAVSDSAREKVMGSGYFVRATFAREAQALPRLHGNFHPVGNTDSEHAFCWLMQELAKSHAGVPSVEELTLTLRELAPQLARHGTVNFMLSNGQALWAHASTNLWYVERRHPFVTAQLSDEDLEIDFAQHTTPHDRVAVVVTAPLTTNEEWTAFEPGELHVFVDGQRSGH